MQSRRGARSTFAVSRSLLFRDLPASFAFVALAFQFRRQTGDPYTEQPAAVAFCLSSLPRWLLLRTFKPSNSLDEQTTLCRAMALADPRHQRLHDARLLQLEVQ
ncbi:hypothetical protein TGFOU_405290 [Toxoplasma gondii FOU]|uniref:Uncharacterized protein n=1 Tax=Toxoplasma gondii FOU TaxID=943167 RepID=A0A086KJ08_TOXGO|nr:hypothetical protein TGFOU_405290 [Toxoplasma gondii FOU]